MFVRHAKWVCICPVGAAATRVIVIDRAYDRTIAGCVHFIALPGALGLWDMLGESESVLQVQLQLGKLL